MDLGLMFCNCDRIVNGFVVLGSPFRTDVCKCSSYLEIPESKKRHILTQRAPDKLNRRDTDTDRNIKLTLNIEIGAEINEIIDNEIVTWSGFENQCTAGSKLGNHKGHHDCEFKK